MSYSVVNNAVINGNNGAYDNKVNNSSAKYGRNAVSNYMSYLDEYNKPLPASKSDLSNLKSLDKDTFDKKMTELDAEHDATMANLNSAPPLKFEYQYMQKPETPEKMDKMALLGAAFEEMGKKISMPVEQMTKKLQDGFGEKASAKAFDVNNDNQVDIGEYASSILLQDMMSKDAKTLDVKNITGTVNNDGQNNLATYMNIDNGDKAKEIVSSIHKSFDLNTAKNFFAIKPGNTVE